MTLERITSLLNTMLAGERHTYNQLKPFLDKTIDDINAQLQAKFPVFSELPEGSLEFNLFPDRYIRSVVVPGAAWYYFTTDEEGISTASQYMFDYERCMALMVRDYINLVPLAYRADLIELEDGSFTRAPSTALYPGEADRDGERGITVDAFNIFP